MVAGGHKICKCSSIYHLLRACLHVEYLNIFINRYFFIPFFINVYTYSQNPAFKKISREKQRERLVT